MKNQKYIVGLLWLVGSFFSCQTIQEFPDENLNNDSVAVNLKLLLDLDLQMTEAEYLLSSRASAASVCDMRMTVAVYKFDNNTWGTPLYKYVATYPDAQRQRLVPINYDFRLSAARYLFVAWADYVQAGSKEDLFYNTKKLNIDNTSSEFGYSVSLPGDYIGNTDFKDAFCGYTMVDLEKYKGVVGAETTASVELKRPLAKVEIITTDWMGYKQKSNAARANSVITAEFVHSSFFPSSYNVISDNPNDYMVSPRFVSEVQQLNDSESLVGFDYVFVGRQQTEITLGLVFRDQDGKIINRIEELRVPVKQNQKTTVRSKFLTGQYASGVVINPDFEQGDIVVNIPD